MKLAVYSLYQHKELNRFRIFLERISKQLSDQARLFILVNDNHEQNFERICHDVSPNVEVLCADRNLGVASGRNYLLEKALDWGGELFVSCDNDIIYPDDYLEQIKECYLQLLSSGQKVGMLQPLLLDGRKLKSYFGVNGGWNESENILSRLQYFSSSLLKNIGYSEVAKTAYHAGISNVYSAHFGLSPKESRAIDSDYLYEKYSYLADKNKIVSLMESGRPAPIHTCAGGVSVLTKELLSSGLRYDRRFDPFLYEDSEFGYRAKKMGFKSFLLPNCLPIHDFFMGHSNRKKIQKSYIQRLRAIEMQLKNEEQILVSKTLSSLFHDAFVHCNDKEEGRFWHYFCSAIFNLFYGLFQREKSFDDLLKSENVIYELLLDFWGTKQVDLKLPLRDNLFFKSSEISFNANTTKGILGIHLFNCRFEENSGTSRYFDLYVRLKKQKRALYLCEIDVQSDDLMFKVKVSLDLSEFVNDPIHCEPRIKLTSLESKQYDYGNFSVEELYPAPNFPASSELLESLKDKETSLEEGVLRDFVAFLYRYFKNEAGTRFKSDKSISTSSDSRLKVLIYTDSRGQHVPNYSHHVAFPLQIKSSPNFDVDCVLCPMKWTTTLDFIEYSKTHDLTIYDAVILYTGIVDWSPRPHTSAFNELYKNQAIKNLGNIGLNSTSYSKKVVNDKSSVFDEVFGKKEVKSHLNGRFKEKYQDEETINMYSLTMADRSLIPRLNKIPNLIFINSNPFVDGWEGDYGKERPSNIGITRRYSELFAKKLACDVIDISQWSNEQVKLYTCDNLHLSATGNDYILNECLKRLDERYIEKIGLKLSKKEAFDIAESGKYEEALLALLRSIVEFGQIGVNVSLAFQVYSLGKSKGYSFSPVVRRFLKRLI
ncbi:hypothetical protein RJ43_08935 [Alteromonas macleodii]|uniref:glycosyltransferase n=1 Tax=Alteromonas macleodii TaxID=28108 RepID=UPI00057F8B96|nr:glycosyltransferase [Alteromonas macleodii]KHT54531.1 hypothetical protein RJ43_08935 [Alteromonas macleodii]